MKRRDHPDNQISLTTLDVHVAPPDGAGSDVTPPVDGAALRHAVAAFPTGVVLLAAQTSEGPTGVLLNSFTSLSLDPPLVLAALAHTSTSWPRLREAPRLGLTVLADHHDEARTLLSRPAQRRFDGVDLRVADDGAITLPDAAATLTLAPHAEHPGGDHTIAVYRVLTATREPERGPLVFHSPRYLGLPGLDS